MFEVDTKKVCIVSDIPVKDEFDLATLQYECPVCGKRVPFNKVDIVRLNGKNMYIVPCKDCVAKLESEGEIFHCSFCGGLITSDSLLIDGENGACVCPSCLHNAFTSEKTGCKSESLFPNILERTRKMFVGASLNGPKSA